MTAKNDLTWQNHLAIGGLSRAVAVSSVYPIDTIKTIVQNNSNMTNKYDFRILYKGYLYAIITQSIYGMAVFGTYEIIKAKINDQSINNPNNLYIYVQSALTADLIGSLFLCPCEVIKQNIQVGKYTSPYTALKDIIYHHKLKGLYKGYDALLLRDLPFRVIQLPLYDKLKEKYDTTSSPIISCSVGATAGMVAAAITTPIDVIKTNLMCNPHIHSIKDIIHAIYAKQGLYGFIAGLPPRVIYLGGASSIFFMSYESLRNIVQK